MSTGHPASKTAFEELGFSKTIEGLLELIRDLYQADETPWTIGYSGGKDSTAVTQLVWMALEGLPEAARTKPVYVITTDTLVENPVVAAWVNRSLETMKQTAAERKMPVEPNLLTPDIANTFWVNLIGRGYPAPRPKFRWCTERLKIKPSNRFIENVAGEYGEVILLLGARRQESAVRAHGFKQRDKTAVREFLTPHPDLHNTLVFTPIETWSNDDVWTFLLREKNPWNFSNKDLLSMYRGASEDNECPVVIDTSTPSCGNSRFGCWTCTVVEDDKAMENMVDGGDLWMEPLLEFRNLLKSTQDPDIKSKFRTPKGRQHGRVKAKNNGGDGIIPRAYKLKFRKDLLRKLLETEKEVNELRDDDMEYLDLIRDEELKEIRRIWRTEEADWEDSVPKIYNDVMDDDLDWVRDDLGSFSTEEAEVLERVCERHDVPDKLVKRL